MPHTLYCTCRETATSIAASLGSSRHPKVLKMSLLLLTKVTGAVLFQRNRKTAFVGASRQVVHLVVAFIIA